MKALALIALAVCLFLPSCASVPPQPSPCALIENTCGNKVAVGLRASKTVQTMLNSPMLISGAPADPNDWPASVYVQVAGGSCSATLVGDRVLFMAAHCMMDGEKVSFSAHANQYKATCTHHPEYKGNDTADWAMCLVDRPVTGIPFEVLNTAKIYKTKEQLLLSGYGCIRPGGGGGNDGIFRTGRATIKGLPSGKIYDIVTQGGAALCFGDSGGSAYYELSSGVRYVVGINSRGDIESMSYLSSVYSEVFVNWANAWAKNSSNVRICGMHADAIGCRGASSTPLPDGKFELETKAACVKGVVKPDSLPRKEEIVEQVRKTLENY